MTRLKKKIIGAVESFIKLGEGAHGRNYKRGLLYSLQPYRNRKKHLGRLLWPLTFPSFNFFKFLQFSFGKLFSSGEIFTRSRSNESNSFEGFEEKDAWLSRCRKYSEWSDPLVSRDRHRKKFGFYRDFFHENKVNLYKLFGEVNFSRFSSKIYVTNSGGLLSQSDQFLLLSKFFFFKQNSGSAKKFSFLNTRFFLFGGCLINSFSKISNFSIVGGLFRNLSINHGDSELNVFAAIGAQRGLGLSIFAAKQLGDVNRRWIFLQFSGEKTDGRGVFLSNSQYGGKFFTSNLIYSLRKLHSTEKLLDNLNGGLLVKESLVRLFLYSWSINVFGPRPPFIFSKEGEYNSFRNFFLTMTKSRMSRCVTRQKLWQMPEAVLGVVFSKFNLTVSDILVDVDLISKLLVVKKNFDRTFRNFLYLKFTVTKIKFFFKNFGKHYWRCGKCAFRVNKLREMFWLLVIDVADKVSLRRYCMYLNALNALRKKLYFKIGLRYVTNEWRILDIRKSYLYHIYVPNFLKLCAVLLNKLIGELYFFEINQTSNYLRVASLKTYFELKKARAGSNANFTLSPAGFKSRAFLLIFFSELTKLFWGEAARSFVYKNIIFMVQLFVLRRYQFSSILYNTFLQVILNKSYKLTPLVILLVEGSYARGSLNVTFNRFSYLQHLEAKFLKTKGFAQYISFAERERLFANQLNMLNYAKVGFSQTHSDFFFFSAKTAFNESCVALGEFNFLRSIDFDPCFSRKLQKSESLDFEEREIPNPNFFEEISVNFFGKGLIRRHFISGRMHGGDLLTASSYWSFPEYFDNTSFNFFDYNWALPLNHKFVLNFYQSYWSDEFCQASADIFCVEIYTVGGLIGGYGSKLNLGRYLKFFFFNL